MEQNKKEESKVPKKSGVALAVAAALIILAAYLGYQNSNLKEELKNSQAAAQAECVKQKNLGFALMFIEKVLQAEGEIDFETRLQLENAVRDLNDKEILVQWQKFTSSKDEKAAQAEVKNLLRLTIERSEM